MKSEEKGLRLNENMKGLLLGVHTRVGSVRCQVIIENAAPTENISEPVPDRFPKNIVWWPLSLSGTEF